MLLVLTFRWQGSTMYLQPRESCLCLRWVHHTPWLSLPCSTPVFPAAQLSSLSQGFVLWLKCCRQPLWGPTAIAWLSNFGQFWLDLSCSCKTKVQGGRGNPWGNAWSGPCPSPSLLMDPLRKQAGSPLSVFLYSWWGAWCEVSSIPGMALLYRKE